MSFQQNIQNFKSVKAIADEIIQACNNAEILKLVKKHIQVTKKYAGVVDSDKIDLLAKKVNKEIAAHLHSYLVSQSFGLVTNRFDASTYLKRETDSFSVGEGELCMFDRDDKQETIKCSSGAVGSFSPYCAVINTAAMIVPSSTAGTPNFSQESNFTISESTKGTLGVLFQGVLKDDGPEAKKICLSEMLRQTNDIKQSIFSVWLDSVPLVNSKRILDFKFNATTGAFTDISAQEFTPFDFSFVETWEALSKRIMVHTSGCANRRFLIHSIDSWVGVPTRSPFLREIISLYEAGVSKNDAVFVTSADKVMVTMLRLTFGDKVYGIGTKDFMITLAEARCRKFDWVYYTEPIKLQSGKFSYIWIR